MDPQAFIRLSIGSLGLRLSGTTLNGTKSGISALSSPCLCEIRLRGFPVQTSSVPFISSPEATVDIHNVASSFYLEESDLKALLEPGCFYAPHACLEIVVFTGHKGGHCGVGIKRQQVGTFKLEVGPEWGDGKPVTLFNGWIGIGKNKQDTGKPGAELHLRVKLDPDPRYVFQFEDKTKLSPQIVQLQGNIKQPIFSCKFSQDRYYMVLFFFNSNMLQFRFLTLSWFISISYSSICLFVVFHQRLYKVHLQGLSCLTMFSFHN